MFKRRKDEERTELDAAWEDENPNQYRAPEAGDAYEERSELDAAWDDENPSVNRAPSSDVSESDTSEAPALEAVAPESVAPESTAPEASAPESAPYESEPEATDEAIQPTNAGEAFPEPHAFDLSSDSVPVQSEERDAAGDLPFDVDNSFAYDAESEEFTSGDATGILDDSHSDYYRYGEKMHGVHDTPENPEALGAPESNVIAGRFGRHGSGRSSKQAKLDQMPEHVKRSRRVRRVLVVVAILLVALLGALGYFGWRLYQEGRVVAEQETSEVTTEVEVAAGTEDLSGDLGVASTKTTNVPPILELLGLSQDEALAKLGNGAVVTLDSEITDESSPMSHRLTVVLTSEPTDSKSGAPTIYLGMGPDEKVVVAGYSAATASLGYGTLSFIDVVSNHHVVERTFADAGLSLEEGTVQLPEASTYTTYGKDGTTLVKEQCTFDGEAQQDGKTYTWTSVLVYNYTAANATGNLADTVRQVYIYVSDKEASDAIFAERERAEREAKEKEEAERKAAEEAARKAEEEAARAAEEAASSEAAESSEGAESSE